MTRPVSASDPARPFSRSSDIAPESPDESFPFAARSLALFLMPVLCFILLTEEDAFFAVLCGSGIFAALPVLCIWSKKTGKKTLFRACLCLFILLSLGYIRVMGVRITGSLHAAELVEHAADESHRFTGTVDRAEVSSLRTVYVRLTHMDGKPLRTPLLTYAENPSGHFLPQYEILTFTAKLRLPETATAQTDSFDRKAYLKSKGVYAELYEVRQMEFTGRNSLDRFGRKTVCQILFAGPHAALATRHGRKAYSETSALLDGLLYGDKGDFSKEDKENFALSGLTHILCVSGLHFSLVFGLFGTVIGWFVRRRRLRILFLFAVSVGYLYICGFTPSALRAAFMAYTTLFGLARKKPRRCTENLLIAVAAICFLRPEVIFDIGFRLSVLSCTGILLSTGLRKAVERRTKNRLATGAFTALLFSVSAYGFTFFYSQSVFGSLGLGNIAASCIGVFPAQICLGLAWVSVLVVPLFPASAGLFGVVFARLTTLILGIAAFFAKAPRLEPIFLGNATASVCFFGIYFLAFLAARNRSRGVKLWFAVIGGSMLAVMAELLYSLWR